MGVGTFLASPAPAFAGMASVLTVVTVAVAGMASVLTVVKVAVAFLRPRWRRFSMRRPGSPR